MHKHFTRFGAAIAAAVALGLGMAGNATAQIALTTPDGGPYSPTSAGQVSSDSVRIKAQIYSDLSHPQAQGVFIGSAPMRHR